MYFTTTLFGLIHVLLIFVNLDVKKTYGDDAFSDISGNPLEPSYTLPKVLWYKKHLPDMYKNIYKVLQSNAYIAMMLTDKISQDYSQGYGLANL